MAISVPRSISPENTIAAPTISMTGVHREDRSSITGTKFDQIHVAFRWQDSSLRLSISNCSDSYGSRANALTTRMPARFSCVRVFRTAFCSRVATKAGRMRFLNCHATMAIIGANTSSESISFQLMNDRNTSAPMKFSALSYSVTRPPAIRLRMPSMSLVMRLMISPMRL